ncbi:MAG: hypothetical protein ACYS9X_15705 [Planctomycetota bacterium]|jgi:hypothetical protein
MALGFGLLAEAAGCASAVLAKGKLTEGGKLAALIIVMLVVVGLLIVVAKIIMEKARFPCQYCNKFVDALWDMPNDYQGKVVSFLREREGRDPDVKGIFLCERCRIVYDDFSGEKASRDPDPFYGYAAFCKVCWGVMFGCDPGNPDIRCKKCGTGYEWETDEGTGLRFLMAQGDVKVRKDGPTDRADIH